MESDPTEIQKDGTKIWRNENGDLHREDGPARIYSNGEQHWCINGKFHREDGPAVIYPSGTQFWYFNDTNITNKIHKWAKDRDIDLNNLTDIDKMIISMEWGNYGK